MRIPLKTVKSTGDWTPVSINFDVPEKLSSAYIYFETNGNSDMYIDDVSVIFTKDGEEPAPVIEAPTVDEPDDITDVPSDSNTESDDSTNTTVPTDTSVVKPGKSSSEPNNKTSGVIIAIILIAFGSVLTGYGIYMIAKSKKG